MKSVVLARGSVLSLIAVSAALGVAACDKTSNSGGTPTPTATPTSSSETHSADLGNPPQTTAATTTSEKDQPKDPLKEADSDMRKVLVQLGELGGKPLETLSAEDARKQPTPTDAVMALLKKDGKSTAPIEMAKVENRKIPGAAGPIDARIYTPKTDDKKPLPVIVYYHGGGWVIADLDVYDASPRALAKGANAIVVSADYRKAPEAKFPAQHDDAYAAWDWVTKNAASFGGDPKRIAVAGESAGGNLAANVAIMARDKNGQIPVHELLVYPVAQTSFDTKSYNVWANAKPLNKAMMGWFLDKEIAKPADKSDPRLDLVHANLKGLPKTTIVNAEIDPLASDGEMLEKALQAAGVSVDRKQYEGVTHEFFGMGAYVGDAKDAESYAAGRLKDALKK